MTYDEIINDLNDEINLSKMLPEHLRPTYWVRKNEDSLELYWSMQPDLSKANGPCGEKIFLDGTKELMFLPPAKVDIPSYTRL